MLKKLLAIFQRKNKSEDDALVDSIELTTKTIDLINIIITSEEQKTRTIREIKKYCLYVNKYLTTPKDKCQERFAFALLKLSLRSGSFRESDFSAALELGMDYRDLFMSAGFGSSIHIHNDWAEKILNATK